MKKFLLSLAFVIYPVTIVLAEPLSTQTLLIYQQERQKALQDSLNPISPDIHLLLPSTTTGQIDFPVELLCFNINQVELIECDSVMSARKTQMLDLCDIEQGFKNLHHQRV
ncbi:hypothetical protein [Gilliamella sp. ESL0250]|uniref:hypothetical protein n=1 Tax=Gilliamella sp. ESL0250 TaxID=2705036 RepID=UPI00157FF2D8|nr:hypothetical protein [Gilliamella sp. ESL0250]NUF50683.1 hypothetical protein [Gilliamella sp. ESL0250]